MTQLTRAARAVWSQAQVLAVFGLCVGAGMVLPLTLASIGFHTA